MLSLFKQTDNEYLMFVLIGNRQVHLKTVNSKLTENNT